MWSKSLRNPGVIGIGAVIVPLGLAVGFALYKAHQDRIHYQSSLHHLAGEIETVLFSLALFRWSVSVSGQAQ